MTRSRSARLFVAVELPAAVTDELCRWTRHAVPARDGVRRLDAAALHATLCFLGHQPVDRIDEVAEIVGELAGEPVGELSLGAPVWLPPRRPRALAVELHDGDGSLGDLQRRASDALEAALDWEPEHRRFRPHVTVVRLGARAGAVHQHELPPTPALAFAAEALVLYRSHLHRSGAEYEALASVPL